MTTAGVAVGDAVVGLAAAEAVINTDTHKACDHKPIAQPADTSALAPPNYDPFDLQWTTAILHHNENLRRLEAAAP